jgi:aminopeptidase-like protein
VILNTFSNNLNTESLEKIGINMYKWLNDLFPICRSITGPGTRASLRYINDLLPELVIKEVPSGTKAFDWVVPDEWTIREAFIEDELGNRIIDFRDNNLHVVGYSEPVDKWISFSELEKHIYSLEDQPTAIPYITSYYSRHWGFCMSHEQRKLLKSEQYHVVIDSDLKKGVLNYAELVIKGKTDKEVLLSTYICHPSMANNELSGPIVTTALAQWLSSQKKLKYTYRIIFIPETIGSIVYLSKNIEHLKKNVISGFNVTCIGDDRNYSFLPSRNGKTISDKIAKHVLKHIDPSYKSFSWLDRGSDERQYCAPGVDLPIVSIMRSKYGEYPEYHTSLDNLDLVTKSGLVGGFEALRKSIIILENDCILKSVILCEPQLGKRGLYPQLSTKNTAQKVKSMMNLISLCDGENSLLEIAEIIDESFENLYPTAVNLIKNGIIEKIN